MLPLTVGTDRYQEGPIYTLSLLRHLILQGTFETGSGRLSSTSTSSA